MEGLGWPSFFLLGLITGWNAGQPMKRGHGLLTSLLVDRSLDTLLCRILVIAAGGLVGALKRG